MDPIDAYCERLGPGLSAEPVNALTNVAFLVAALVMWRRWPEPGICRVLSVLLAVIGLGSGLFHTFATPWAAAADTLPILAFILVYVHAVHRVIWGQGALAALAFSLCTVPWIAGLTLVFARLPGFEISAFYWPVPLLILLHAVLLRSRTPGTAAGFAAGACLLSMSLVLRSLDQVACQAFPLGTHFLWHLINAVMLAWMIEVLGRHGRALAMGRIRR
ncbi:hypothetical protein FHG66_03220 [Rubellimicrobium rubrum]|uniref:Ceramidase n=1 Tax=Rubellimicrobium rubrum TaxID=2585369 RepID=A0A5C4N485_9RHOB|nr:ceramidase domain-containing protein [Rubellimicrobium rubrum]TNC51838.1 hypothetical protein FHG66_03220 [Rubellimicrobium rubrum]